MYVTGYMLGWLEAVKSGRVRKLSEIPAHTPARCNVASCSCVTPTRSARRSPCTASMFSPGPTPKGRAMPKLADVWIEQQGEHFIAHAECFVGPTLVHGTGNAFRPDVAKARAIEDMRAKRIEEQRRRREQN